MTAVDVKRKTAANRIASGLWTIFALIPAIPSCDLAVDDGDGYEKLALEVSAKTIVFDPENPDGNVFTVTSSAGWHAESDNPALEFSPESGDAGTSEITVTGLEEGQSGTITVTTDPRFPEEKPLSAAVKVTRVNTEEPEEPEVPVEETLVYYDDLDGETGKTYYLDQGDGFVNATGPGAGNVSYSGQGISVRSSYASMGYDGASGNNALNFGYDDREILISGITLEPGQTRLRFSFGATPPSGENFTCGESMKLYVDFNDGSGKRTELDFDADKGTRTWVLASAVFEISGGTPSGISFTLWARGKNTKVDDFMLVTTTEEASQTVEYDETEGNVPWPEMPETVIMDDAYKFVTHWSETVTSRKRVRNYSACYDTERHNPVWVAYPHHECYTEGGWGRTDPDPWRPDPLFEESEQSIIYGSDWAEWPWDGASAATDLYQYWSPLDDGPFFGRGHILRSADRGGHETELNIQTFYPTNIAPERFLYPDVHSELERLLSDEWVCRDTIYVVAGCHYEEDSYYVYDACSFRNQSSRSKICDLPSAEYKVYLRTKSGNTGKRICDCQADELMAIGFWLPQDLENRGEIPGGSPADFAYSVDEIEEMLGGIFEFFPEAPDGVTATFSLQDWGIY